MNKRLFLLPGFGEDTFCFNNLIPYINKHKYKIIHVDYRPVLKKFTFPFITVQQFSKQLVNTYAIQSEDKLLGHSMGGYFSFQTRELLGNEICMIGAFNDPQKVIHTFPKMPRATMFAVLSGLIKTNTLKEYLLKKIKDENYRAVQEEIMDNFDTFSNYELALMLEMNYQKKIDSILPNPLRIHDKNDKIIAAPDEEYTAIKGGHFCLNLYPEDTYLAMQSFLEK